MCTEPELIRIAEFCKKELKLGNAGLSDEYYYQSLPYCVIDAVYSIGVKYSSTRDVVIKYCKFFKLQRIRQNRGIIPGRDIQESIQNLIEKIKSIGIEEFTEKIFDNRQRTSPRNGILKSEAVYKFAEVLERYNVNYFQDIQEITNNIDFKNEIKCIPGQKSGISLDYFFMLAGSDDLIKPDRMILGFIGDILQRQVGLNDAHICLQRVCEKLKVTYPNLTPRLLDYVIWNYQRER